MCVPFAFPSAPNAVLSSEYAKLLCIIHGSLLRGRVAPPPPPVILLRVKDLGHLQIRFPVLYASDFCFLHASQIFDFSR